MSSAATYPVATVAKLLLLTERRVQQLTKDGVLPRAERGRYELAPVVQSYVGYLRDRALPGADEAASDAFHRARARRMTAEANLSEMRDAEARGELIPAADVRAVLSSMIVRVRAKLLSIPPRLAPRVVGCTSLTDAEEAIRQGVHDALDELAGTQVGSVAVANTSLDPDAEPNSP